MRTALLLLLAIADPATAQPGPDLKIDAATRTTVIEASLAALAKSYVFPDVATKMTEAIKKHVAAKKYDTLTSARAFSEALTADLRAISHDKHIVVSFSTDPVPERKDGKLLQSELDLMHERMQFWNAGIVKAERLDGNVGYVRIDGFAPVAEAAPRIAPAMSMIADTGALIIDLRFNGGGDPYTVVLLVSYLFPAGEEHHVNDFYSRLDNSTQQMWTVHDVSGRRYPKNPVFVLTSKDTFSGAEEFAYDMQTLKRATIVGDVTGGGANPGDQFKVHRNFEIFVPTGRAINPVTKTNWEGVGVKPDVQVAADTALDTAYLAALGKVRATLDPKKRPRMVQEIDNAIAKLKPAKK